MLSNEQMTAQTQAEIETTLGDQYGPVKAKIEGFLKNKSGDSPDAFMKQFEDLKSLVKNDSKKIEAFISLQSILAESDGEI